VIVAWGLDVAASTGAVDAFALDWRLGLGAAAGGAILSLLTSLVSAGVGPSGTPSTVDVVEPHPGLFAAFSAWVAQRAADEFGVDAVGRHALREDPYQD
ncbi:MAG: holin, partial [Burkholderiales bacterium]